MAAYPELSSHEQNLWNQLFAAFSKELLFLQSKYPSFGKFYFKKKKNNNFFFSY